MKRIQQLSMLWDNANIYDLLTDRFLNGDPSNDLNFEHSDETAVIIKKLDSEFGIVLLGKK